MRGKTLERICSYVNHWALCGLDIDLPEALLSWASVESISAIADSM